MSEALVSIDFLVVLTYFSISLLINYLRNQVDAKQHQFILLIAIIVVTAAGLERLNQVTNEWLLPESIILLTLVSCAIAAAYTVYTVYRCKPAMTQSSTPIFDPSVAYRAPDLPLDRGAIPLSSGSADSLLYQTLPVWLIAYSEEKFTSCWQSTPTTRLFADYPDWYWINPADQALVFQTTLHHFLQQCAQSTKTEHVFTLSAAVTISVRRVSGHHLLLHFHSVTLTPQSGPCDIEYGALKQAFNASIAGVFVFDAVHQQPFFINDRFEKITGYSNLSAMQKGPLALWRLVHKEDRKKVMRHFRLLMLHPGSEITHSPIQFRFFHAKQKWVWLMGQYSILSFTPEQTIQHIMGSHLDITHLHRLQNNLVRAKEEAEQANQTKTEFLANMSHEIRTPMNAVLALTDMVLQMELGTTQREYLSKVQQSSQSLLGILNDILDYSKLEAGKLRITFETFDLYTLLSEVLHLFSVSAGEKKLQLLCDLKPDCPRWVVSDAMRIKQIISNLVGNAIKFTESGSVCLQVHCQKEQQGQSLQFKVIDTGIGMEKEQLATLFAAFSQADNSICRRYGGSGLGLSISRKLAELLNGQLNSISTPASGSRFCFSLPLRLPEHSVPPSGVSKLQTGIVTKASSYGRTYHYCEMLNTEIVFQQSLSDFFHAKAPECDILLVDLSSSTPAEQRTIMHQLLTHGSVMSIRSGLVLIGSSEYAHSTATDIILNQPSVWVFPPYLPSDLESAMVSLVSKLGAQRQIDPPQEQVQFAGCRALVVEDNLTNQYVAQQLLSHLGFTVKLASNGEQALSCVEEQTFDVIFMDLQMPGMDGYSTTLAMKQRPALANIPIIAMSAAVLDQDKQRVINTGMDAHIPKPVDRQVLLETLKKYLKPKAQAPTQSAPAVAPSFCETQSKTTSKQLCLLLPGFNIAGVLRRLGGDTGHYRQLLVNFNYEFGEKTHVADLHSKPEHQRYMHSLKGLAATIGAERLSQLAADAEKQLAAGRPGNIHIVADELGVVLKTLRHCLANLPEETTDYVLRPLDDLDELRARLEKRSYLRQSDIARYRACLERHFGQQKAQQICQAMARLDYSRAIQLLSASPT
ncbi:response regulator [Salinimonas marina]|uniref:Sensory/regulatory protein RpfC n=1 Tax=Salinimonas marina TaxID=2785918 RepID=A0A7S9DZN8_9ALTE|nr:ATP-binding protein [Salinimonas marina]QPG06797.1 response regulator [Salinimonas marina]